MNYNQANASEQAMVKAKEIRAKLTNLYERVKNEEVGVRDIILAELQDKGLSEEKAQFIISELQEGIASYEAQKSASEEHAILTEESLSLQLEGMPADKQKEKLIQVLLILSFLANTDEDLKVLRTTLDVKSIEELKTEVIENAAKISYKDILDMLHGCTDIVSDSDREFFENFGELSNDYKLYVATQVYLEADKIDAKDEKAQLNAIGATSAAAVDVVRATISLEGGEMSEPMWHSVVKGILVVLTTVLIATLLSLTIVDSVMNVFILFTALFGFTGITAFIGMVLGFAFGGGLIWLLYRAFDSIESDGIEEIDKVLERWMTKIDEWIIQCKEYILAQFEQWKESRQSTDTTKTETIETIEKPQVVTTGENTVINPNPVTV